jgi:hypothetical protein
VIRCFGKILTKGECQLITKSSDHDDSEGDFYQQPLDLDIVKEISSRISAVCNLKNKIYSELITAIGSVDPHTDNLTGLLRTAYVIPVMIPKHRPTFLFEQRKNVKLEKGYLYTFNQWQRHGITFDPNDESMYYCRSKTMYLCSNVTTE